MASSAIRKVQEKLFRGGLSNPSPPPSEPEDRSEPPALTINIPKPSLTPATPTPPPKLGKPPSDPSPQIAVDPKGNTKYRQYLAQKLGGDYQGAEKHRLQQDGDKEKHWKRWGPYLSDRQWVSAPCDHGLIGYQRRQFCRLLSVKIILLMVTHGAISLMNTRGLVHIAGAKTVSRASRTITNGSVLPSPFGMERTRFSRSVSLASLAIREIMAKTLKSSITISTRLRRTLI